MAKPNKEKPSKTRYKTENNSKNHRKRQISHYKPLKAKKKLGKNPVKVARFDTQQRKPGKTRYKLENNRKTIENNKYLIIYWFKAKKLGKNPVKLARVDTEQRETQ